MALSLRARTALAVASAGLVVSSTTLDASPKFWDGGGSDNNFSTPANWASFFGVPANDGTDDIFMQGTVRLTPLVDIDFDILSLQFSSSAGPFAFQAGGQAISIRGGGIINNDTDLQIISQMSMGANHSWNAATGPLQVNFVRLGGPTTGRALTVTGGFDTSVQGTISGSVLTSAGSIALSSSANLTLAGLASNTFTGPVTVNSGTLLLNKTAGVNAIPGNLIIGDGAGSDVVKLVQSNQIADVSNLTINSSGVFTVNGGAEAIGNLTVNGGSVAVGGGALTMNDSSSLAAGTIDVGAGVATFGGVLTMTGGLISASSGTVHFASGICNLADGVSPDDAELSGFASGSLVKSGPGQLAITGTGASMLALSVNEGTVALRKSSGSAARDVTVGTDGGAPGSAVVRFESATGIGDLTTKTSGRVELNGYSVIVPTVTMLGGHIATGSGTLRFISTLEGSGQSFATTIEGNLQFFSFIPGEPAKITGSGYLDLNGPVSAFGQSILIESTGFVRLRGATSNGPSPVSVQYGRLLLAKDAIDGAIPGGLTIGSNAYVGLEKSEQISPIAPVRIAQGSLALNGFDEAIGDLQLGVATITTGGGVLTVAGSVVDVTVPGLRMLASISGNLHLTPGPHDFDVGSTSDADATLDVSAVVSGDARIRKIGPGAITLSGGNTFVDGIQHNAGKLVLSHPAAAGPGVLQLNGGSLEGGIADLVIANTIAVTAATSISAPLSLELSGAFNNSLGFTLSKDGASPLTVSGPQTHGNGAILEVFAGAIRLTSDSGSASSANLTANVEAPTARLDIAVSQHLASLNVNAGSAVIEAGGNWTLTAKALTIDTADSLLDINEHAIIVDHDGSSPLASIRSSIISARNDGAWNGFGITSSLVNNSTHGVGYADSIAVFTMFPASFKEEEVDNSAVLIRYTRYGDATLDGVVNANDFTRLATNFGLTGKFWSDGDFNYDGRVNANDFTLLASNFGLVATGLNGEVTPQDWANLAAAVPEPGFAACIISIGILLPRFRRKG